jgi:hypothetical protein
MSTNPNMTMQVSQNIMLQHQALVAPAPLTGLDESIPVIGTVTDYDYAHLIDTLMEKTLVCLLLNCSVLMLNCFFLLQKTLPFMPLAALDKFNCGKYIHGPAHDLESLLLTALEIVAFTNGPCGNFCVPTDHVPIAQWYNKID